MRDGRVVIITGATGGLGQEIARRFGRSGCRIVVHCHRNQEAAEKLADELGTLGAEAIAVRADVRSLDQMRSMTESALDRWSRLDILVANAAIRSDGLFVRMTNEAWDSALDTNLTGVWNGLKAAGETFIKQREGHVVAIGSIAGLQGRAGQANYAASKAGLIGLIRSAAAEWGPYNIRLNLVFPGVQPTGMTANLSVEQQRALTAQNLLDRSTPIIEAAEFVYQLSRMTAVSGQIFNLDSRIP
ncbi:MAG TPA: SDR family NAD(P)-dependent oxidoreductase [Nitrospiria bacterium]